MEQLAALISETVWQQACSSTRTSIIVRNIWQRTKATERKRSSSHHVRVVLECFGLFFTSILSMWVNIFFQRQLSRYIRNHHGNSAGRSCVQCPTEQLMILLIGTVSLQPYSVAWKINGNIYTAMCLPCVFVCVSNLGDCDCANLPPIPSENALLYEQRRRNYPLLLKRDCPTCLIWIAEAEEFDRVFHTPEVALSPILEIKGSFFWEKLLSRIKFSSLRLVYWAVQFSWNNTRTGAPSLSASKPHRIRNPSDKE